jgi:hypothetical protein
MRLRSYAVLRVANRGGGNVEGAPRALGAHWYGVPDLDNRVSLMR